MYNTNNFYVKVETISIYFFARWTQALCEHYNTLQFKKNLFHNDIKLVKLLENMIPT